MVQIPMQVMRYMLYMIVLLNKNLKILFLITKEGNTPLMYGAHGDHPHVCYELLSKGADITRRNMHNISAYHIAVLNNSLTGK